MKKIINNTRRRMLTAIVAACLALATLTAAVPSISAQGQSYNPYLIQGIINQTGTGIGSTMLPVEFNGAGVARFDVGNTGSSDIVARPGDLMTLVITLSKGVPNNADPLAALGGPGVEWFAWQYDPAIRTYFATQNATIPGDSRRTITIQYRVTENSFLGASPTVSNGFNVNLQPPGYTNPQPTDDDAVSAYTYVEAFDYGDAPSSYGAAWHTANLTKNPPTTGLYNSYMYMGAVMDPEVANQASFDARGDDANQTGGLEADDEDGVTFPTLTPGQSAVIPVVVTLTAPGQFGALNAWIDWDGDGDFADTGEQIATNTFVIGASTTVNINATVPANAITSQPTFARFRIGPPGASVTGAAPYGEVEDYQIQIGGQLSVLLAAFSAQAQADHVLVAWETTTEYSNTGFNLYRALEADGERTLLGWVPSAMPGSAQGAAYSFQDFEVTPGQTYWYFLEDIDLNGATTLHGPASAVFQAPTAVTLAGLRTEAGQDADLWPIVVGVLALAAAATFLVIRHRVAS